MPSPDSSYDHRSVGRELDLFCSDELVGAGLPMWLPDGALVRDTLARWIVDLERSHGDQHVCSPPIAKRALYEISGHWDHYADGMWPPMRMGDEEYVLRPMNCPHHILLFRHQRRSYRELPLRFAELGTMFRNELSGAIGGLSRVRCMTLNDAHAFCAPEQVATEIAASPRDDRGCVHRPRTRFASLPAFVPGRGRQVRRRRRPVGAGDDRASRRPRGFGRRVLRGRRRSGVLRPEDRRSARGRARPRRNRLDHPGRPASARALRPDLPRHERRAATAGDRAPVGDLDPGTDGCASRRSSRSRVAAVARTAPGRRAPGGRAVRG